MDPGESGPEELANYIILRLNKQCDFDDDI